MTDHTPTSDHDADLLASLYLDGEATADEIARIEASPALLARVETFQWVADAVGATPDPPPGLAERQIGAALDALGPASDAPDVSNVVPLTRRRSSNGVPVWIGVAAGLLVAVGGVGFALAQVRGGSDDDVAASLGRDAAESAFNQTADAGAPASTAADQASSEVASDSGDADGPTADGAMDDAAESEAADTAAMEDDAMEESGGGDDDAGSPTTTTGVSLADFVTDLGPSAGRSAFEIAQELLLDPDLQLDPLGEAECFGSPALRSIAQPTGFVNVLLDEQLVEVVFFETPETTDPNGSGLGAIVLARGDCAIVLE